METVNVTQGVLQGDSLSPLIFSLFISDLIVHLKNSDCNGVNVDHHTEITALMYADGLVLLDDNWAAANKKLKSLSVYCHQNYLTVNPDKSKILIFKREGRVKSMKPLFYDNFKIEI
uniref:Reverse transcriptase domain-containing protein n=1 Tax=Rhodnius prolixus TaxID=13249 RepID=T1H9R8_RHOPR